MKHSHRHICLLELLLVCLACACPAVAQEVAEKQKVMNVNVDNHLDVGAGKIKPDTTLQIQPINNMPEPSLFMPFSASRNIASFATDNTDDVVEKMMRYGTLRFSGAGGSQYYSGMLTVQDASLSATYKINRLSLTAGAEAHRYFFRGIQNQYGVHGSISYQLGSDVALVGYAQLYNTNPFFSMAAYPYVHTSQYGGYVAIRKGFGGIDLGMRREYDPFQRRWYNAPIITPTVKVGKVEIGIPIGDFINSQFSNNRSMGPITPRPQPRGGRR